jgi:MFS family permease
LELSTRENWALSTREIKSLKKELARAKRPALAQPALIVFALALVLYIASGATEFATDDSAEFQLLAPRMGRMHPPGYPAQMLLGGALRTIIGQDAAARGMTLLSALWSALAAALLFRLVARATGNKRAGLVSAAALGMSHTFWMHGGLAEAYALNALALAVLISLFEEASRRPNFGPRAMIAAAWVLGFAAGNHLTILLFAPVLAAAMAANCPCARRPGPLAGASLAGISALGAMFAILAIRFGNLGDPEILAAERPSVEFAWWWMRGGPSRELLFAFGPMTLLKRLAVFGGYFIYQFPSPALFLIPMGAFALWRSKRWAWLWLLGGVFAVNLGYGLNFDSSDVYVFYVPCHLAAAIAAGFGAAALERRFARAFQNQRLWTGLIAACVLMPPIVYFATPRLLNATGFVLSRNKGNLYYLWPPKRSELRFWNAQAEALARTLPEGSPLLTNWNTYHLMAAWLDRTGRSNAIRLINLPRDGAAFAPPNWASYAQDELMLRPAGRVWSMGDIPGLRDDPLYKVRDVAGIKAWDLATHPLSEPSFQAFRTQFEKTLREGLERRKLIGPGEPLIYRPFHDAGGRIEVLEPGARP